MRIHTINFSKAILGISLLSLLFSVVSCKETEDEASVQARHRPRNEEIRRHSLAKIKKPLVGLFVDAATKSASPTGKTWADAFPTINQAIAVASTATQDIYVAAGTYKSPNLDLTDKKKIRLIGGYKSGDRFEKEVLEYKDDEFAILDGEGNNVPLVTIRGDAAEITFSGGFTFQNVVSNSAVVIEGTAPKPIKDVTIVNSRFKNNNNDTLNGDGGGIRVSNAEDVIFNNLYAEGNKATRDGGFLAITQVKNIILIEGTYKNNESERNGGAVYMDRASRLTMRGQLIENNRAPNGGGMYALNFVGEELSKIKFVGNEGSLAGVDGYGAGLALDGGSKVRLIHLSFKNNRHRPGTDSKGGAMSVHRSKDVLVILGDEEISGNKASSGGAFSFTRGVLAGEETEIIEIRGGRFSKNNEGMAGTFAPSMGGSLYFYRVKDISIVGSSIADSEARMGGGIYIEGPDGRIALDNVTTSGNIAADGGGGLWLSSRASPIDAPSVLVTNSSFIKNRSNKNGGAFYTQNISYRVVIRDTEFRGNSAKYYGGALALDARTRREARFVIDEGTQFFANSAEETSGGGAIFFVVNSAHYLNINAPFSPNMNDYQLVFFNSVRDYSENIAKDGKGGGNFMRITEQNISATVAPGGAVARLKQQRPLPPGGDGEYRLRHFLPYSDSPNAPFNRVKFNIKTSTDLVFTH